MCLYGATNRCAKRVNNQKDEIETWEKMKAKLNSWFLPSSYLQDSCSQIHNLNQGNMSIYEYTREFKNS